MKQQSTPTRAMPMTFAIAISLAAIYVNNENLKNYREYIVYSTVNYSLHVHSTEGRRETEEF